MAEALDDAALLALAESIDWQPTTATRSAPPTATRSAPPTTTRSVCVSPDEEFLGAAEEALVVDGLNEEQRTAARAASCEPLLILAGAGSGKTLTAFLAVIDRLLES